MNYRSYRQALLTLAFCWSSIIWADDASKDEAVGIRYDQGRLTLHAQGIALSELLGKLDGIIPVPITVMGELDASPQDWRFDALPLTEALKFIVRPHGSIVVYANRLQPSQPHPLQHQSLHQQPKLAEFIVVGITSASSNRNSSTSAMPLSVEETAIRAMAPDQTELTDEQQAPSVSDKPDYQKDEVEYFTDLLLHSSASEDRVSAAQHLAMLAEPRAIEELTKGLGDKDPAVRQIIIQLLGEQPSEPAIVALGQVLFAEKDADLRDSAVNALGNFYQSPAALELIKRAQQDPDPQVRQTANQLVDARE